MERNKSEHDLEGDPIRRKKEKIIAIILEEVKKKERSMEGYDKKEFTEANLMEMQFDSLERIKQQMKDDRERRTNRSRDRIK
jgi:hypothetical protein